MQIKTLTKDGKKKAKIKFSIPFSHKAIFELIMVRKLTLQIKQVHICSTLSIIAGVHRYYTDFEVLMSNYLCSTMHFTIRKRHQDKMGRFMLGL